MRSRASCGISVCVSLWLASGGVLTSESYNEWVAGHFTAAQAAAGEAAPHADPDGDGILNLADYALGRKPHGGGPCWTIDPAARSAACPVPAARPDALTELECSADLVTWCPAPPPVRDGAMLRCSLPEGMPFLRLKVTVADGAVIDSDGDGLHDLFEEELAARFPDHARHGIGDIHPGDDFDGDGIPNLFDPANHAPGSRSNPGPALIDPRLVVATLAARTDAGPTFATGEANRLFSRFFGPRTLAAQGVLRQKRV